MKKCIVCVLTILALFCLGGCQKGYDAPELLEPVGVEMDTAVAEKGALYNMEVYEGEVVPYVEIVSFSVDGQLKEFSVAAGDMVEAGQVLARLEDEELLEEIEKLEAEIADLNTAGAFVDRKLAADIEIASTQLEQLKSRKASEESIRVKELELEMLKLDLQKAQELRALELHRLHKQVQDYRTEIKSMELVAPFSGKVVYINPVGMGDFVQSMTPVVGIADEAKLTIAAEYITPSRIENAYQISAQILDQEFAVTYEPYTDSEYVQQILSGSTVNSSFSFGEEIAAESGQYVVLKLWHFYKEDVLTVPVNCLHRDEKGYYVYKIEEDARVRCNIEVGLTTETKAEILSGLEVGDVVYVKEAVLASEQANYDMVPVQKGEYLVMSDGTASLEFPDEFPLAWDKAGSSMKEILVEEGQEVKAGDVLMTFTIESDEIALEELKLQLQRKKEDYIRKKDEKEVLLAEAEEDAEEITNGYAYRIAVLNIEKQRIAYEQYVYESEKAIAKLEEEISEKQAFVSENKLTAPFDGVIGSVYYFDEGDDITVGEELLTMFATDTLVIRAYGSEEELRYNMDVTLEGSGFLSGRTYHGCVVSAPNILPASVEQNYAVIQVEEDIDVSAFLRGGRPGRGFFSFDLKFSAEYQKLNNLLLVDKDAVQKEEGKSFVYIVEDGAVHKRYVTVGLSSRESVWILDGLSEGQQLILD